MQFICTLGVGENDHFFFARLQLKLGCNSVPMHRLVQLDELMQVSSCWSQQLPSLLMTHRADVLSVLDKSASIKGATCWVVKLDSLRYFQDFPFVDLHLLKLQPQFTVTGTSWWRGTVDEGSAATLESRPAKPMGIGHDGTMQGGRMEVSWKAMLKDEKEG